MEVPSKNPNVPSIVSQASTSASSSVSKRKILGGQFSKIDKLFPLLDEISQSTRLSNFFYCLCTFYVSFQLFTIGLYSHCLDTYGANAKKDTYDNKVLKILRLIAFFHNGTDLFGPVYAQFIIFFLVLTFALFFIIVGYSVYLKNREFSYIFLCIIRFFMEIISLIMLIPITSHIGLLAYRLITRMDSLDVVLIVFDIVFLVVFAILYIVPVSLFSASPFLKFGVTAAWNPIVTTHFVPIWGLFSFFEFIFSQFPRWMSVEISILGAIFSLYVLFFTRHMNYIKNWMNAYVCSMSLGLFSESIVQIICFWVKMDMYIGFIVGVVVTCIGWPILYKLIIRDDLKIVQKLTHSESNKIELILTPKLIASPNTLLHYLHVGVAYQCDFLLDWALIKGAAGVDDTSIIIECLKIITFFPPESRLLNLLLNLAFHRKQIGYTQRFVLYQAERIKSIRQSNSSSELTDQYSKMMSLTESCMSSAASFWQNIPSDFGAFQRYGNEVVAINRQWEEQLFLYPNNFRFREEYSRFLIECSTDFTGGILQKHKASLIDQGHSFSIDFAFRSFVRTYPYYLKHKIIDFKGNILKNNSHKSSATSSASSPSDSLNSSDLLNVEIEESIGRQLFQNARMRIALQNALQNKRSKNLLVLRILSVFFFCVMMAGMLIYVFQFAGYYNTRFTTVQRILTINNIRSGISRGSFYSVLRWSQIGGAIFNLNIVNNFLSYDTNSENFFTADLSQYLIDSSTRLRTNLSVLMKDLTNLAESDNDISQIAIPFIEERTSVIFCASNLSKLESLSESLQGLSIWFAYTFMDLASDSVSEVANWKLKKGFCNFVGNMNHFREDLDTLYESFAHQQEQLYDKDNQYHHIYAIVLPISVFALCVPLIILYVIKYGREMSYILHLLIDIDNSSKEEAALPIMRNSNTQNELVFSGTRSTNDNGKKKGIIDLVIGSILMILLHISFAALLLFGILYDKRGSTMCRNLFQWEYLSSSRYSYLYECLTAETLVLATLMGQVNANFSLSNPISPLLLMGLGFDSINRSSNYNSNFTSGSGDIPPITSYDNEIDSINFNSDCDDVESETSNHRLMRCSSLSQSFELIFSYLDQLHSLISTTGGGGLSSEAYFSLAHIITEHMADKIANTNLIIIRRANDELDKYNIFIILFGVFEFLLAIIILVFSTMILNKLNIGFKASLIFIRRLSPQAICSSLPLLDYLLNRTSAKNDSEMSLEHSVMHNSQDAIVCFNRNEVIELVNLSVTSLLGFTPEQLLGQSISILFQHDDSEDFLNHIELMKLGQCPLNFKCHTTCINDDEIKIRCNTTLIGMGGNKSGEADSFVVILQNEEELKKQQEIAEQAKQQSEDLLYHILPRDIVVRINQGEKNISFSVPSSTISFLDIQKFSEYAAALTPSQTMGTLSLIFNAFDRILPRYPLIIKIKLIGDTYMAAAGIFNPNVQPAQHAEQMIRFCLEALQELDDINLKLSSSLQIRVGINTGGPLIAGVLGTEKPAFDIIGDPINVAARLQSTCIPNRVQISQSVYDLVNSLEFTIEKRGEVFLKGKGKANAYLVLPSSPFPMTISSDSISGS